LGNKNEQKRAAYVAREAKKLTGDSWSELSLSEDYKTDMNGLSGDSLNEKTNEVLLMHSTPPENLHSICFMAWIPKEADLEDAGVACALQRMRGSATNMHKPMLDISLKDR